MEHTADKIIRERRSIYPAEFTGAALDKELILHLISNANYAPNHHATYPWRFVVAAGEAKNILLQKAAEFYRLHTPAEKYNVQKEQKILGYRNKVSHLIAIVMHREPDARGREDEDRLAVACAVQNMWLTLSAYPHAGGYWSTGLGTYRPEMHAYLRLGDNETLMGFFVLGEVKEKRTEGGRRNYMEYIREL